MLATLPDAPLDIIGDIHGECEALQALLHHLGYRADGTHHQGRRLVFVGDLCDRGPDSPAVIQHVQRLVEAERAQAILGNHEINLLRGERKSGNNWFWAEDDHREHRYEPYARLDPQQRQSLLQFLGSLPMALQRDDLRVVHAAWDDASIARLQRISGREPAALFAHWDEQVESALQETGLLQQSAAELAAWQHAIKDESIPVPLLEATGRCNEQRQTGNPLRVLTSGVERLATSSFFTSGEWRFAERVRWWDHYDHATPVVIGHYWRQFRPLDRQQLGKGDSDIFGNIAPTQWHGARSNVFCVDFSVGGRYQERRARQKPGINTKLAALRWPERTLVLDTGETLATSGFGN